MKRIYMGMLTCGMFFMLTILIADEKGKRGDDFLMLNDNIQNEELRAELALLREEFNMERTRIQEYYNKKIGVLKEARRGEVKTIKKAFAKRREALMKKYIGKIRKNPKTKSAEPIKNTPDKMKVSPKDTKRIRKQ